jgi:hypothetical protein
VGVCASVDRIETEIVPVREQPRRRALSGTGRAADPEDVVD